MHPPSFPCFSLSIVKWLGGSTRCACGTSAAQDTPRSQTANHHHHTASAHQPNTRPKSKNETGTNMMTLQTQANTRSRRRCRGQLRPVRGRGGGVLGRGPRRVARRRLPHLGDVLHAVVAQFGGARRSAQRRHLVERRQPDDANIAHPGVQSPPDPEHAHDNKSASAHQRGGDDVTLGMGCRRSFAFGARVSSWGLVAPAPRHLSSLRQFLFFVDVCRRTCRFFFFFVFTYMSWGFFLCRPTSWKRMCRKGKRHGMYLCIDSDSFFSCVCLSRLDIQRGEGVGVQRGGGAKGVGCKGRGRYHD